MFTCDIVFFLTIDTSVIDDFQERYFPRGAVLEPHIKLLRQRKRVPVDVLTSCVEDVVSSWKPFDVHLSGVDRSHPEGWLLLQVRDGNERIVALQKAILESIKEKGYANTCDAVDPGVVLGFFAGDRVGRNDAYEEAVNLDLSYRTLFDRVAVAIFKSGKNKKVEIVHFKLGLGP